MQQPTGTVPIGIRRAVAERAGCRCERCGKPGLHSDPRATSIGLELHHINGIRGGENDCPENLTMVCDQCHAAIGKKECPECGRLCGPGAYPLHLDRHVSDVMRAVVAARVGDVLKFKHPYWRTVTEGVLVEALPNGRCRLRATGQKLCQKATLFGLIWDNPDLKSRYEKARAEMHGKWRDQLWADWVAACANAGKVVDHGIYLSRCPDSEYRTLETMFANARPRKVEGE